MKPCLVLEVGRISSSVLKNGTLSSSLLCCRSLCTTSKTLVAGSSAGVNVCDMRFAQTMGVLSGAAEGVGGTLNRRQPIVAALLSLLIPSLGQMYAGRATRGAAVLVAAIVIASLNIAFVLLFVVAEPDPSVAWEYWIPRIGHDAVAVWSLAFWIWAAVDAYRAAGRARVPRAASADRADARRQHWG